MPNNQDVKKYSIYENEDVNLEKVNVVGVELVRRLQKVVIRGVSKYAKHERNLSIIVKVPCEVGIDNVKNEQGVLQSQA